MYGANPLKMTYNTGPILLFFGQCLYILGKICFDYGGAEEEEGDQLEEGLSQYQDALKEDDQKLIQGQEEYYMNNYDFAIKTYSDEQYRKLKNATVTDEEHIIMGCATYRLLDSLSYVQFFQYEAYKMSTSGYPERDGIIFITTA